MPYKPYTTAAEEAADCIRIYAMDLQKRMNVTVAAEVPKTAENFDAIVLELFEAADWLQQRHEREMQATEEQTLQIANETK